MLILSYIHIDIYMEMNITDFKNAQIYSEDLPKIEEIQYEKLDPKMITAGILGSILFFGTGCIIVLLLSIPIEWISEQLIKILSIIILIAILSIVIDVVSYRYKYYALRGHDVSYRSGIIFRKLIAIPFNRVQHCEIAQGPIERYFDLATLKIFTAGGSNSDLQIPGLKKENAEIIRGFILRKSASDEEE